MMKAAEGKYSTSRLTPKNTPKTLLFQIPSKISPQKPRNTKNPTYYMGKNKAQKNPHQKTPNHPKKSKG
jgi:hypothetical protein